MQEEYLLIELVPVSFLCSQCGTKSCTQNLPVYLAPQTLDFSPACIKCENRDYMVQTPDGFTPEIIKIPLSELRRNLLIQETKAP